MPIQAQQQERENLAFILGVRMLNVKEPLLIEKSDHSSYFFLTLHLFPLTEVFLATTISAKQMIISINDVKAPLNGELS